MQKSVSKHSQYLLIIRGYCTFLFFVLSLQNPVCLALRAALRSDQPRFEDQRPRRLVMPTVDPAA